MTFCWLFPVGQLSIRFEGNPSGMELQHSLWHSPFPGADTDGTALLDAAKIISKELYS